MSTTTFTENEMHALRLLCKYGWVTGGDLSPAGDLRMPPEELERPSIAAEMAGLSIEERRAFMMKLGISVDMSAMCEFSGRPVARGSEVKCACGMYVVVINRKIALHRKPDITSRDERGT